MMKYFRFPRTPHLAWLGPGHPRDDKVLSPEDAQAVLRGDVVVEEKVDGANVGFSSGGDTGLHVQNRGSYVERRSRHSQFQPLFRWLAPHEPRLREALGAHLMLFGEWCWAVHSVRYDALPDWFLAFDVYDRERRRFWSVARRDDFVSGLGLALVPRLGSGHFDFDSLIQLLDGSKLGGGPLEGIYIRRDDGPFLAARAKLVRAEFAQALEEHWSMRPLEQNRLADGTPWH